MCASLLGQWSSICGCWPCAWDPVKDLGPQRIKAETDTAAAATEQVDWESKER